MYSSSENEKTKQLLLLRYYINYLRKPAIEFIGKQQQTTKQTSHFIIIYDDNNNIIGEMKKEAIKDIGY